MLFDSHAHVASTTTSILFRPEYTIETIVHEMDYYHIDKSIVMVNPLFEILKCPVDVHHKVAVQDTAEEGRLRLFCTHCRKILYEGPDPVRQFNIELIEATQRYPNRFFPMLYILLSNSTIPTEVKFYESNYPNAFTGYKLHPRFCFRSLEEIKNFPSIRPILIHTGVDYPLTPTNVQFVKNYKGNIILAHAGRFDPELLALGRVMKNVFIDTSPSSLMYKGRITDLVSPFNELISEPVDIYKYLIEYVGEDKILFGSDVPWGDYNDEIEILNLAKLTPSTYDKISHLNLINALKY